MSLDSRWDSESLSNEFRSFFLSFFLSFFRSFVRMMNVGVEYLAARLFRSFVFFFGRGGR